MEGAGDSEASIDERIEGAGVERFEGIDEWRWILEKEQAGQVEQEALRQDYRDQAGGVERESAFKTVSERTCADPTNSPDSGLPRRRNPLAGLSANTPHSYPAPPSPHTAPQTSPGLSSLTLS